MRILLDFLNASRERHSHLCPRQVLGVRIALAGLRLLGMEAIVKPSKNLIVISETDGCFVDGIEVTAHVSVGHRSLKIEDYGKIAATFLDLKTRRTVRLHPSPYIRELARKYSPSERKAYLAQLKSYQAIPDRELLAMEWVTLDRDLQQMTGSPRQHAHCIRCGEEILNGREVTDSGMTLCKSCAGYAYYHPEREVQATENSIVQGHLPSSHA